MQVRVANASPGQVVVANPYNYPYGAAGPPPGQVVVVQTAPANWKLEQLSTTNRIAKSTNSTSSNSRISEMA